MELANEPRMVTPAPLKAMVLPSFAAVPPMTVLTGPGTRWMPLPLPRLRAPVVSVPMKLPWIWLPSEKAPVVLLLSGVPARSMVPPGGGAGGVGADEVALDLVAVREGAVDLDAVGAAGNDVAAAGEADRVRRRIVDDEDADRGVADRGRVGGVGADAVVVDRG